VAQYVSQQDYVSNYRVDVLVDQGSGTEVGGQFLFHMVIQNTGINTLSADKYFYIVAFNPSGKLSAIFPTPGTGYQYVNVWSPPSQRSNIQQSYQPTNKWADWSSIGVNFVHDVLFNGTVGASPIWYRVSIPDDSSNLGTWKIYILVFDKVYLDRWDNPLTCKAAEPYSNTQYCPPDLNNALTSSLIQFDVTAKAPTTSQPITGYVPGVVQFLVTFGASYIGYLREAKAIEGSLTKAKRKISEHWFFFVVILVVLLAYLLGKH
jgi:hypothetical protein